MLPLLVAFYSLAFSLSHPTLTKSPCVNRRKVLVRALLWPFSQERAPAPLTPLLVVGVGRDDGADGLHEDRLEAELRQGRALQVLHAADLFAEAPALKSE